MSDDGWDWLTINYIDFFSSSPAASASYLQIGSPPQAENGATFDGRNWGVTSNSGGLFLRGYEPNSNPFVSFGLAGCGEGEFLEFGNQITVGSRTCLRDFPTAALTFSGIVSDDFDIGLINYIYVGGVGALSGSPADSYTDTACSWTIVEGVMGCTLTVDTEMVGPDGQSIVPEPSSTLLLASGLLAFSLVGKCGQKRIREITTRLRTAKTGLLSKS